MKHYNPNEPLISVHVPKCAGTSLMEPLKDWFGDHLKWHYFDEFKKTLPEKHELGPGDIVHGHFNSHRKFGVREYYPGASQFITFLRDPVEIAISNYFFIRKLQAKGRADGAPDLPESYTVNDFLSETNSYLLAHLPFHETPENYEAEFHQYFCYVGVVEDMQGSLDNLADVLGKPPVTIPRENVSARTEEIDEGAKKAFRERNSLACDMYEYARSIYQRSNEERLLRRMVQQDHRADNQSAAVARVSEEVRKLEKQMRRATANRNGDKPASKTSLDTAGIVERLRDLRNLLR